MSRFKECVEFFWEEGFWYRVGFEEAQGPFVGLKEAQRRAEIDFAWWEAEYAELWEDDYDQEIGRSAA